MHGLSSDTPPPTTPHNSTTTPRNPPILARTLGELPPNCGAFCLPQQVSLAELEEWRLELLRARAVVMPGEDRPPLGSQGNGDGDGVVGFSQTATIRCPLPLH